MFARGKDPGPIERNLAQSDNPKLQRLCQMDNVELLDYMDQLIEAGGDLDEELYDAAQALLNERAPIEKPSVEEVIRSWEAFKAKCPEAASAVKPHKSKPARRTFTLRRGLAVAALVATLLIGLTVGVLAATNVDFQDLGEVVVRNLKYGGPGQLENLNASPDGYTSLADAINKTNGSDTIKCVTWVPSDFSLATVTATENESGQYNYSAYYESDERSLLVVIYQQGEMPVVMEKNGGSAVTPMQWQGFEYLIVENDIYVNCEWEKGGYTYSVAGNISTDEMRSVVKSFK